VTSKITVDMDGALVQAEVVRSDRAKVTRIQVGLDRPLRVVVPAGATEEYARDALLSKRAWVVGKLRAIEKARSAPDVLGLATPGVVWVGGESLPILLSDVWFAREEDGVLLVPSGDGAHDSVRRWYRRRARSYLRALVDDEAIRLGRSPARVMIRDQKTRWGSCAASGTVSLNWRLLLMPEAVARYVVAHELIHLDVPNHSKAFWRALTTADPDWRVQSQWLRAHGDEIRRYQPQLLPDFHLAVGD
jgi:predicted metal-dependent hydrolase